MPDAFAVLEQDHQKVKDLLAQIDRAAPGSQDIEQLVQELIIDESRHEAVEEAHFWPVVRDKVEGGEQLTQTALDQETEGKEVLAQLEKLSASDAKFMGLVETFTKAAHEHIAYEEQQVWPKLRLVVTKPELDELGQKLADAKQSAPTRPHPHTPSSPAVQKVAGPVAGAADKVRDTMTGRN